MWQETTRCINWMMTELYVRDIKRNGQEKLPPMPHIYLYPEARALFPCLPPQTVSSLEQSCQHKYRARRLEVVWRHKASLPTHRYPVPFPVPNQSWEPGRRDIEKPVVSIRIADRRYTLRLRGGPRFWRQRQAFDLMVAGRAVTGEAAIYEIGTELMVKPGRPGGKQFPTAGPGIQTPEPQAASSHGRVRPRPRTDPSDRAMRYPYRTTVKPRNLRTRMAKVTL